MRKVVFIVTLITTTCFGQELKTKSNILHLTTKENFTRTSFPAISWVQPRLEYSNSLNGQIEIEASVRSSVNLKTVYVAVMNTNGTMVGSKPINVSENPVHQLIKQNIRLTEGSYTIEIVAENTNGVKVSSIRNLSVGDVEFAKAVSTNRKDYGLLFATDIYDYWSDLVNPVYDATAIAAELKDQYGFDIEVVTNATQEEMLVKIKEYSGRNYKPQDQLFIFFAGHGQFDEVFGEGYIVAKNSLERDPAKTSFISHSNLRSYINNIPCDHILLAMDVCFGGTLDPVIARARGNEVKDELSVSEFLVRKLSKKTRRYITSGGKEYVSDGIVGQHSPFATRFLESLKSRGLEDGILTLNEMLPYFEKITSHEPRSGEFGENEKGSDFVFIVKQ